MYSLRMQRALLTLKTCEHAECLNLQRAITVNHWRVPPG